jgi:alpha-glucosidase
MARFWSNKNDSSKSPDAGGEAAAGVRRSRVSAGMPVRAHVFAEGSSTVSDLTMTLASKRRAGFSTRGAGLAPILAAALLTAWTHPALASAPATPTTRANAIIKADLFSDQGTMYDSNQEPSATQPVTVMLRTGHDNVTRATIKYYDAGDEAFHDVRMTKRSTDPTGKFDYWRGTIPAGPSEKYYRFEVTNGAETVWYNAAGASATQPALGDFFIIPGFRTPNWMKNGVMYEIFVDSFYDGDPRIRVKSNQYTFLGCAAEHHAWGTTTRPWVRGCGQEVFFGGDLAGIEQKLGYIKHTLGANILYLTPIFEAPTNHKYDTTNYYRVDPSFGTARTLEKLIHAVHSARNGPKGYIILDGVFNHTGGSNCWFGRYTYEHISCHVVGAYKSRSSPYYSWYTFQHWPDDYSSFENVVPDMPKLNYGTTGSPVREQIYASRHSVVQTYLRRPFGIDGWRLDSAQMLDANGGPGGDATNHQIMRQLRAAVLSVNPHAEILGEYWGNPAPWLDQGNQWDGAMNYNGFTNPLSEWMCGVNESGKPASIGVRRFSAWLHRRRADLPVAAQETMTNELGTHDTPRFATRCGGVLARSELAMVFQFTYIGTPTIYYGDEYGMQSPPGFDNRRTFIWSKAARADPPIALAHKLIVIRRRYAALRTGSFITLLRDNRQDVYAFGRFDRRHRIAVVLNASDRTQTVAIPVWQLSDVNGSGVTDLLDGKTYRVNHGVVRIALPGYRGAILEQ